MPKTSFPTKISGVPSSSISETLAVPYVYWEAVVDFIEEVAGGIAADIVKDIDEASTVNDDNLWYAIIVQIGDGRLLGCAISIDIDSDNRAWLNFDWNYPLHRRNSRSRNLKSPGSREVHPHPGQPQ